MTDMGPRKSTLNSEGVLSPEQFLTQAGDEDVLRFLRRLPIFAGQEDGRVTLADLIFEMQLWPYVKSAWSEVEGSPGIAGRTLQMTRVYPGKWLHWYRPREGARMGIPQLADNACGTCCPLGSMAPYGRY